jgi:uncharacterized membrane protein YphA (DoxX/SURF4 family)
MSSSVAHPYFAGDWRTRIDPIDRRVTAALARSAVPVVRVSLGVVFLWFGALKFIPGLSPAEDLAGRTIDQLSGGMVGPALSVPVLAAWECLIGLGFLSGRFLRATLLLMAVQMIGTFTPLLLFPAETFTQFPYAPTLEGQYIIKNVVLIAAAMVLGATVRGGRLEADPASGTAAEATAGGAVADPPGSVFPMVATR